MLQQTNQPDTFQTARTVHKSVGCVAELEIPLSKARAGKFRRTAHKPQVTPVSSPAKYTSKVVSSGAAAQEAKDTQAGTPAGWANTCFCWDSQRPWQGWTKNHKACHARHAVPRMPNTMADIQP